MLLNIEARIGELYEALPKAAGRHPPRQGDGRGRQEAIEDVGITNQRANRASEIHRNPAAVAAVIAEAHPGGGTRIRQPSRGSHHGSPRGRVSGALDFDCLSVQH